MCKVLVHWLPHLSQFEIQGRVEFVFNKQSKDMFFRWLRYFVSGQCCWWWSNEEIKSHLFMFSLSHPPLTLLFSHFWTLWIKGSMLRWHSVERPRLSPPLKSQHRLSLSTDRASGRYRACPVEPDYSPQWFSSWQITASLKRSNENIF